MKNIYIKQEKMLLKLKYQLKRYKKDFKILIEDEQK